MKESYLVQVAEYAEAKKLLSEPDFAWWALFMLKKHDKIIGAVKARLNNKTHKYGVLVPNAEKEAYMLDKKSGNTLWQDSISKEMKQRRMVENHASTLQKVGSYAWNGKMETKNGFPSKT